VHQTVHVGEFRELFNCPLAYCPVTVQALYYFTAWQPMKDLVTYMNRMVIGCFMVESGDNE
jgi:hypothetical protein